MIISFFGHSKICVKDDIQHKIEDIILRNADVGEQIHLYCGGYGDFDALCLKACLNLKKNGCRCEIAFITPYLNIPKRLMDGLCSFDQLIYPPLERVPLKYAIAERNKWIVDKSDLIISYVKHNYGGAYSALCYAKRKNKIIINLADSETGI